MLSTHLIVGGDDLRTALAWFFDRSLAQVAKRISNLPRLIALIAQSA